MLTSGACYPFNPWNFWSSVRWKKSGEHFTWCPKEVCEKNILHPARVNNDNTLQMYPVLNSRGYDFLTCSPMSGRVVTTLRKTNIAYSWLAKPLPFDGVYRKKKIEIFHGDLLVYQKVFSCSSPNPQALWGFHYSISSRHGQRHGLQGSRMWTLWAPEKDSSSI